MKILILSLFVSLPALAARESVSLDCSGRAQYTGDLTMTVRSLTISDDKTEGTMKGVVVTLKNGDDVDTGRGSKVGNDVGYRPTKYKNHLRFDLTEGLKDKNGKKFYPSDSCHVWAMVPNNAVSGRASRIEIPTEFTCDQSGGAIHLDCKVE